VVEGDCEPQQDALELTWFSPIEARQQSVLAEMAGGQGALLQQGLDLVGRGLITRGTSKTQPTSIRLWRVISKSSATVVIWPWGLWVSQSEAASGELKKFPRSQ
jgi:hypothetical protein